MLNACQALTSLGTSGWFLKSSGSAIAFAALSFTDLSDQINASTQISNSSIALSKIANNSTGTVQYFASVGGTNQFAEIQNSDIYVNGTNNYLVYVSSNRLAFQ